MPSTLGGRGYTGCDVLDKAGVDRIDGLAALLPQDFTTPAGPVVAASQAGFCPVSGPVWGAGNILLGGAGSDTLEGRGGDDIIDGDRALTVRISLRTDPSDPDTEIGSTDLMEHPFTGPFGDAHPGMTAQQAVFAGLVDPRDLVIVRQIDDPTPAPGTVDTAVFSDLRANYDCIADGVVTSPCALTSTGATTQVVHHGGSGADGTDTLRNIERLQFADVLPPLAPKTVTAVAGDTSGDRHLDRSGGRGDRLHGGGHQHEDGKRLLTAAGGSDRRQQRGGHRPQQRHAVQVPGDGDQHGR